MFILKCCNTIFKFIKRSFYKYTFIYTLFAFTMLFLRIIQVEYKIEKFNFIFSTLLFALGVLIFYFYTIVLNTRLKRIEATILLIVLACLTVMLTVGLKNLLIIVTDNYKSIQAAFFYSTSTYFKQFEYFLAILIPIFIAVILYINSKNFGWLIIVLTLIFMFTLGAYTGLAEIKVYILIYIILCVFIFCYSRFMKSLKKYKAYAFRVSVDNKKIINYLLIVSVAVGVFSYVGAQAFGTKSIFARIQEYKLKNKNILELDKNKSYDLGQSGYGRSDNKLGGPISLDHTKIFRVNADRSYYLKGITKDFYDGFSWSKTEQEYKKLLYDDINNKKQNLEVFLKKNGLKLTSKTLEVYPEGINTSTLFAPEFTFNVQLSSGEVVYNNSSDFMMRGIEGVGKSYRVHFYESDEEEALLKEGKLHLTYDEKMTSEYKEYLQLPGNIPPEVYSLVYNLTKECKTPEEKVIKIEKYLTNNFIYSLQVSEVPKGKEFTSYFLFDEKKGYCTYFATACTVLMRIAGVPARYVEGFKMGEEKDSKGFYTITNAEAHAWTEILLDCKTDLWATVDTVPSAQLQKVLKEDNNSKITGFSDGAQSTIVGTAKGGFLKSIKAFNLNWVLYAGAAVFTILIGIKLTRIIKLRNKILATNSCIPLYHFIKKRVGNSGIEKEPPDDDYEWIESIKEALLRKNIELLINNMYEEFYGCKIRSNLKNREIYTEVERCLLRKMGRFSYYLNKVYFFMTYNESYL